MWRESEHYFFKLGNFTDVLRQWLEGGGARQPQVRAKLAEWFEAGLQDWDISRDAPYFGFEIPGAPGKYFYVWFDAPIGYLGSFKALCDKRGLSYDEYFRADSQTELYHFIGKDISYFHNLFWPAVLHGAGCRKPTSVFVHGFLTVNGTKMSKSRGTFITARRYLERLPAEALRFYFAGKLGAGVDDMDLSLDDFVARVNSDIVGKLVNIASRCAGFVQRGGGKLAGATARSAALRGIRGAARHHRRALRRARLLRGHPRHHGSRRSRQPVRRHDEALGAGQGSGEGRRGAGGVHAGHQPVPRADELSRAGAAGDGREGREVPATFRLPTGSRWRHRCSITRSRPTSRWP